MAKPPRDYDVGYGKPPRHTRFKPGQSGNPKGRPKAARSLDALLTAALNERVMVKENGLRRPISKREVVVKQFVNRATSGDLRAMQALFGLMRSSSEPTGAEPATTAPPSVADQQILDDLRARLAGQQEEERSAPSHHDQDSDDGKNDDA